MSNICFKQLKGHFDKQHELHMQEIVDFINEKIELGVEINLIAHPEFLEDKFALYCEPMDDELPRHLNIVVDDEQD